MRFEQVINQSLIVGIQTYEGDTQAIDKLVLLNQESKEIVEQINVIYKSLSKSEKQHFEQAMMEVLKRLTKNALRTKSPLGKKAAALYQRTIDKYQKNKSLDGIDQ